MAESRLTVGLAARDSTIRYVRQEGNLGGSGNHNAVVERDDLERRADDVRHTVGQRRLLADVDGDSP